MNCDNCSHYCWYYDRCEKWDCEVDGREVHDCFEPIPTEQAGQGLVRKLNKL